MSGELVLALAEGHDLSGPCARCGARRTDAGSAPMISVFKLPDLQPVCPMCTQEVAPQLGALLMLALAGANLARLHARAEGGADVGDEMESSGRLVLGACRGLLGHVAPHHLTPSDTHVEDGGEQ